jgi:hypothetical protein
VGLDTSHDAWHGAYSAFMRWREMIAEVAGMPPLQMMDGFWQKGQAPYDPATLIFNDKMAKEAVERFCSRLPIKWESLKPDPLHTLLYHSDCDGEIAWEDCGPIADRLEELLPKFPNGEGGGHIGNWRDKTSKFIDGCRAAYKAKENLNFH